MARRRRRPVGGIRSPPAEEKSVCTAGCVNQTLMPASGRGGSPRTKPVWSSVRRLDSRLQEQRFENCAKRRGLGPDCYRCVDYLVVVLCGRANTTVSEGSGPTGIIQKLNRSILSFRKNTGAPRIMSLPLISTLPNLPASKPVAPALSVPRASAAGAATAR